MVSLYSLLISVLIWYNIAFYGSIVTAVIKYGVGLNNQQKVSVSSVLLILQASNNVCGAHFLVYLRITR